MVMVVGGHGKLQCRQLMPFASVMYGKSTKAEWGHA